MDPHGVVIDRFHTRLALVGLREEGPGLEREVARIVRDLVPAQCARVLDPRVAEGQGVVRIDRLRLALHIGREGLSAAGLAERLAQQLAYRISEALAEAGGVVDGVAVWPDHASFAAAYIAHRLGLLAAPDWAFPDFRPLSHLSSAEAAVELLSARPAILPALAEVIADRGGTARLVAALPEPAAADLVTRLAAATTARDLLEDPTALAGLVDRLPQEPAAAPGRAALVVALGFIRSRRVGPAEIPSVFARARQAVALGAVARAVSIDLGRPAEPDDLAPTALLHLPTPVRVLAQAWLGPVTDAATRTVLVAALGGAVSRPVPAHRHEDLPAHARARPPSTGASRVLSSRIAGIGLLLPAALRHALPEVLSPVALHRVLVAGLAEEDRARARLDPLVAALVPFDPRDGEPVLPPVLDSLRAAVPEAARAALADVEGAAGWAGCLLHAFAGMLPGFEASSPGYLRSQFLVRPGRLVLASDRMTLLLAPLPLGVLLRHAGFHGWTGRPGPAGNALLRIEIEDG